MEKARSLPNVIIETLRFISVGVGVTDVVLVGYSYSAGYSEEIFFCATVIITFLISFSFLIFHLLVYGHKKSEVKYTEIVFHIFGRTLMFISGVFMMAGVIEHPAELQGVTVTRTVAVLLGIENGVMYGLIGFLLSREWRQTESKKYGEGLEWEDPLLGSQESNTTNFGTI